LNIKLTPIQVTILQDSPGFINYLELPYYAFQKNLNYEKQGTETRTLYFSLPIIQ